MKKLIAKPLDEKLINLIIKNLNKTLKIYDNDLKINKTDKEFDFFRIVYHHSLEKKPNHYPKIQNYVALYGFSRNITMVLNIFILILLWRVYTNNIFNKDIFLLFLFFSLVTYLMYLSFNKLYRKFTLESIMSTIIK